MNSTLVLAGGLIVIIIIGVIIFTQSHDKKNKPPVLRPPVDKTNVFMPPLPCSLPPIKSRNKDSKESLPAKSSSSKGQLSNELLMLRLDVAVPNKVSLGLTFELAVVIRQLFSPLFNEEDLSEVKSGEVQVSWPKSQAYIRIRVQVHAPDCKIHGENTHSFRLYFEQDSPVFYFQLTSQKTGRISIVVKVFQEDDWLGSARVHTVAVHKQLAGSVQLEITSHPIIISGQQIDNRKLRENLVSYFSESELHTLCFDLDVDYDLIPGQGKEDKIREMIRNYSAQPKICQLLNLLV